MGLKPEGKNMEFGEMAGPAVELASERDRVWFEKHPGGRYYIRTIIPGEFAHLEIAPCFNGVAVTQIEQGCRVRQPVILKFLEASRN